MFRLNNRRSEWGAEIICALKMVSPYENKPTYPNMEALFNFGCKEELGTEECYYLHAGDYDEDAPDEIELGDEEP